MTPRLRPLILTLAIVSLAAGFSAYVSACTPARHLLMTADMAARGPAASPALLAPGFGQDTVTSRGDWQARRPALLAALEDHIFGSAPPPAQARLIASTLVDPAAYGGTGRIERHALEFVFEDGRAVTQTLALVLPLNAPGPFPVIMIASDCGPGAVLGVDAFGEPDAFRHGYCEAGGWLSPVAGLVFGEHVLIPPVAEILARGYALAVWHESEIGPDAQPMHAEALARLGLDPEAYGRPGLISLWAWTMSRVADHLVPDARLSPGGLILYGHSRRAKAVLLAAARDSRFAMVLSLQSGTGGASLHGDGVGEPVASITQSYPHWFARRYAEYAHDETALPVDAHHLLALIAPRPVLLGGAMRDTWSDPAGAFRAAQATRPVWRLLEADAPWQTDMDGFDPTSRLTTHMRGGLHGVRASDWRALLDFADAHRGALEAEDRAP
ncbi:hypothetical protein L2D00_05285 [Hyphomonadaceae bacterium BL14]|nr:hypothetical protein L2D00_05285 [Hyphomonadaceae bacterium BL14]